MAFWTLWYHNSILFLFHPEHMNANAATVQCGCLSSSYYVIVLANRREEQEKKNKKSIYPSLYILFLKVVHTTYRCRVDNKTMGQYPIVQSYLSWPHLAKRSWMWKLGIPYLMKKEQILNFGLSRHFSSYYLEQMKLEME